MKKLNPLLLSYMSFLFLLSLTHCAPKPKTATLLSKPTTEKVTDKNKFTPFEGCYEYVNVPSTITDQYTLNFQTSYTGCAGSNGYGQMVQTIYENGNVASNSLMTMNVWPTGVFTVKGKDLDYSYQGAAHKGCAFDANRTAIQSMTFTQNADDSYNFTVVDFACPKSLALVDCQKQIPTQSKQLVIRRTANCNPK